MITISLKQHVALVTGASLGLGAAVARRLAEAGAAVVVNYRTSATAAADLVASITAAGGRAIAHPADVSDSDAVLFFASPLADFVTGVDLPVAGGHGL
jgi:NAD(P)-dependent dehydrogenase (short-subunit alcohol dehydrogenase family)